MSNPVAGQDFNVIMVAPESLIGATVTVQYKKPDKTVVENVTPTGVDTVTNKISYKLTEDITVEGDWELRAKIVNAAGDTAITNPPILIHFDGNL